MLSDYSKSRTLSDHIKQGSMTAFSAGMINIASLLIFFSFSSNITGHFAILAAEIVKGNLYESAIVFSWIFLFFIGSFISGLTVTHFNHRMAHAIPILLEILCMISVGVYGEYFYRETLTETEVLLALMLFAMGLQNGLTAGISNFSVKTTHLTGVTTDLGLLLAMFTHRSYRRDRDLRGRARLLLIIIVSYLSGGVFSGFSYLYLDFKMFYLVSLFLLMVIAYEYYKYKILEALSLEESKSGTVVNK